MRLILHNLVTLGLCATAYASQEQVILDGTLHQDRVKQVAIIGQSSKYHYPSRHIIRFIGLTLLGAGSAGSSSAYHLTQFAEAHNIPINVTVFEKNSHIGGRSTTVHAYNESHLPIELGASVFVQINKILADAVEAFNLSTSSFASTSDDIPGAGLGIWDGKTFIFTAENEGGWWDKAKLFYKYGLSPLRTLNLMKATVGKFLKMYDEPIFHSRHSRKLHKMLVC